MNNCENCGLPEWAVEGKGCSVVIEEKPENSYKRTRRRTVWCHSEECAVQALAISKYGRASHKWPVTLAQFRGIEELSAVTKNTPNRIDSKERKTALNAIMDPGPIPRLFVTKRGRPRKEAALSGAERMRDYRARRSEHQVLTPSYSTIALSSSQ
jgi:hypothetical protein